MSRHRNVRSLNFNEEYDEYYNTYGQSVEEDLCISPNTERQFMYNRSEGHSTRAPNDRNNDSDLVEEEEIEDLDRYRNMTDDSEMDEIERAKLISCVEEMENVVGDTIDRSLLIRSAKLHGYQLNAALESVLNAHTSDSYNLQRFSKNRGKTSDGPQVLRSPEHSVSQPNDDKSDYQTNSSPLFLSLTAKCSSSEERPKASKHFDIKQYLKQYLDRNNIETFDFENESPDQCVRRLKSRAKEPPKSTQFNDNSEDSEVEKINKSIQQMNVKENDPTLKVPTSPLRRESDRASAMDSTSNSPISSRTNSRISSPNPDKWSESSKSTPKPIQTKAMNPEMVLSEYHKSRSAGKPQINLVVIGHVDAGKSTLMGHLLYLLGFVSKKAIHRYETDSKKLGKNSFLYAWVLDETQEERSRGITMDIAQSRFETERRIVNLLDAPGHKDFIPNMITGATQADVALLVVDATKGEFETGFDLGGQTREHTLLIRSLGISQLGVVVNKLDNCDWNKDRYQEIIAKLSAFLKQLGFKDQDVSYVPCSGLTGENLHQRSKLEALSSWYSGPSLVEIIDNFKPPERPITKPFRLCINDVFKGMTAGVCVGGRIEGGAVTTGQKLVVLPAGEQCVVKSISIDDQSVTNAFAGDHVVLVLIGCDANNISVGGMVCDALNPCPVVTRLEAKIVIYNNIEVPIIKGFPVMFHYQSLSEQAIIRKLVAVLHKSTGQVSKRRPRCLLKNTNAIVEIEVQKPVCLELYSEYKDLGRFTIRSGGATVAAGIVTKIL